MMWHVSLPVQAVAGPERTVVAAQSVCLDANLSYHPLDMPYLTLWQQVAGEPVVLDENDCFVAPDAETARAPSGVTATSKYAPEWPPNVRKSPVPGGRRPG